MDIIFIKQLKLNTIIGIHAWEREQEQPIILDIEIGCFTHSAAQSDQIKDSIDYFSVCERMKKLASNHSYQLVESFAEEVSRIIINDFLAKQVRVTLSKPKAVNDAKAVGITIQRYQ
ncbi:MAG: dihydroneopterin aldolase [Gammaproteobacteria bacterium]|nr:dihydroneopterin aldolase [Gammaproteobacteria bacterium]